jgi:hypothetical protein
MDFQGALRARLLADSATTTIVGQRIYWVVRPQQDALPAITLQTITDGRPQHFGGFQAMRPSMVQIDAWGTTYAQVRALAEAIIAALAPAHSENGIAFERGFFSDVRDLGEQLETTFIHRVSVDLTVFHQAQ